MMKCSLEKQLFCNDSSCQDFTETKYLHHYSFLVYERTDCSVHLAYVH